MRIVVVGLGAAGLWSAISARMKDSSADIYAFCDEKYFTYSRCGLPFVIGGEILRFNDLIITSEDILKRMRINFKLNCRVTDVVKDTVYYDSENGSGQLKFDSLILATGSKPFIPPIKGVNLTNVFTLRTIDDGAKILNTLNSTKRSIIIGAGAIGLEVAEALTRRGLEVKIVELLPRVLPALLDEDMAKIVQKRLESNGVSLILGRGVDEIYGSGKVEGVAVGDENFQCDMVIVATGVRPNVDLAKNIGVNLGVTGGIKTSKIMETNIEGVFAAGDCAETVHLVNGKPFLPMLGTSAYRQGKVAGFNAAGGSRIFPGSLGSTVLKVFGVEIGSTGLTVERAVKEGFKVVVGKVRWYTKAEYYPTHEKINVKLVFDGESGRIIGGQIVGGEDVAQRVNLLAASIGWGMKVEDLCNIDTCYSPPVADTIEPIVRASELAFRKFKR
ncbi:MAG: FAD-dependent oxidoreductase [Candidatus Verstraetearchaeota archaeon]|nr:FAD-dependent oxidoreductase [Candidatus Verstraetearchaeota archaeon]